MTKSPWRLLKETHKRCGSRFVIRKALQLLWSQARVAFRRLRFPLRDFASLPEVVTAHKMKSIPCTNPNAPDFVAEVRNLGIDLIVVAAFSRILKAQLITAPRLGCINVHPSLLPRYRGPNPFYWVLAKQEKKTGVTIHYIDEGIDSGGIILQREFAIGRRDTEKDLQAKAVIVAADLLNEAIPLLVAGTAPCIQQNESEALYLSFPPRGASIL
jgi:methionyl-tRNA formyltransferase